MPDDRTRWTVGVPTRPYIPEQSGAECECGHHRIVVMFLAAYEGDFVAFRVSPYPSRKALEHRSPEGMLSQCLLHARQK